MESAITTGLLAYGMSGKVFHAPFIHQHEGFNLYAVLERNHKLAAKDYPNLISYDSAEEILNDDAIELLIINTPNNTHYDYAKKALLKGKHILIEKPFTSTVAEAKEVFELAKHVGKKIFVYQNRRWDSDFLTLKKVLAQQLIGNLTEVHFRYDRYRATISPKAFKEEPFPASGMQYDLGPHLLDQVISLFGKPHYFHKVLGKIRENTLVDDYFSIQLNYGPGLNVYVHSNILIVDMQPAFVVHGSKGSFIKHRTDVQETQLLEGLKPSDAQYGLQGEGTEGVLTFLDERGDKVCRKITAETGQYPGLFEAVFQSLRNDVPFPVKEEDILIQLVILEAPGASS